MKTIKDLTPEILEKIEDYKKICIEKLYNGEEWKNYNPENTVKYINYIYNMVNKPNPVVIIANTLREYKTWFNKIFNEDYSQYAAWEKRLNAQHSLLNSKFKNQKEKEKLEAIVAKEIPDDKIVNPKEIKVHFNFLTSEYSRVYLMWFKFIKDEFKIPTSKEKEVDFLYDHVRESSICKTFLTENVVLILRMPMAIRRNDVGFHNSANANGAIEYPAADEKFHYLNGRAVDAWVFEKYFSKTLTFSDFQKEKNEETKGAIITLIKENEGNEGLLKFLNAQLVDEQKVTHGFNKVNGKPYTEILRFYMTKDRFSFAQDSTGKTNVPLAWFEETCPSTGQVYLIETFPDYKDALKAAKMARPKFVKLNVPYKWEEFAN